MNTFLYSYAFRDLWRNKTRTLLGIFGVGVSIFLLSTVSFATDSLSNVFVDYLTTDSGNQDLVLTSRTYYDQPANRTDFFDYQEIQDQIDSNVGHISNYLPRSIFSGATNGSATNPMPYRLHFQISSMNVSYEEEIGFGKLIGLEENFNITNGIPVNSCILDRGFANALNLTQGDSIELNIYQISAKVNLTVAATFSDQSLKFPLYEEKDIIVDQAWFGSLLNDINKNTRYSELDWVSKTNNLVMLVENSETIYDVRDISGSEKYLSELGAEIVLTLGLDAWNLDYPKLENLFISEYFSMTLNILFSVITLISMLISGILINGILSTSVEEKIREYGVNRVLGARKSYNLKLIILQGTLMCVFGSTVGIIGASALVKYFALPYLETLVTGDWISGGIPFVISARSIIISYAIGIGVSLVVSIMPALKVMRMKIVDSINPYRHDDAVFKLEQEGGTNYKMIVFGAILALNGGFVYFLIPQAILSFNIGLIATVIIGTLLMFLIGTSLLAIGFMPLLIRFLNFLFDYAGKRIRKLMNIIKITIYRYQRRNTSTIIMFVLSFSFIMFTTSMVEIQVQQVGALIRFNRGSDIQVVPQTYDIEAPTVEMQNQLMQIEGIERTSALLASTHDLTNIYYDEGKIFDVSMGDYINFQNYDIRLYGIDRNYKDTVYATDFITFTEGKQDEAFDKVFNDNETNIIISTALADSMDLHLGDVARLNFQRGDETEVVIANIVGVSKSMPGLQNFKESAMNAYNGGVIISTSNYIKYFNIPGGNMAFVDRIFVKVKEDASASAVQDEIYDIFEDDYALFIRNTKDMVDDANQEFEVIKYVFLIILGGTVIIGLFGLVSSAYSSILERKREIGILRTLGLYPNEIGRLFTIENIILLLSSGGSGGIIGFLMAILLSANMTLFTQSPRIIAIPWDIVGIIIGLTVGVLLIGMRSLLKKVKKQNLIEIFRETL